MDFLDVILLVAIGVVAFILGALFEHILQR
jgi:hypothetical protein